VLTLAFGKRLVAERPLTNPILTNDLRIYEGEFALVLTCPWRIEDGSNVLWTWADQAAYDSPDFKPPWLSRVVGNSVDAVVEHDTAFDFSLRFTSGLLVVVFCDSRQDGACYSYSTPDRFFDVSATKVICEARAKLPVALS
jgi:hypothetical protein